MGAKSTQETRDLFNSYGFRDAQTPVVILNGAIGQNALLGPQDETKYTTEIEKRLGASSTAMIEASMTEASLMTAAVKLTNLSTNALGNIRLYAVVYEDLGTSHNHYLVRDITPIESFTLSGHTTVSFELVSNVADSSAKHMVVILKSTSGTILQSVYVK